MPETSKDLWTSFLDFLSQIITPSWGDLILLLPFALMLLVVGYLVNVAIQWRSAAPRNRARVPRPLASGAAPPGVHLPGPSRWPFVVPIGVFFILLSLALRPRAPGATLAVDPVLFGVGILIGLMAIAGWLWDAMHEWRRTEGTDGRAHGGSLVASTVSAGALHAGSALAPDAAHAAAMMGTNAMTSADPGALSYEVHDLPPGIHLPGPSPWPFFVPPAVMFVLFGLVLSPALIIGGLIMAAIAIGGWYRDATSEYRQVDAGHLPEPATRDPRRAFPMSLVKVYALIAALSIAVIVAPGVITTLVTRPSASGAPVAGGSGAPVPGGPLSITAKGIKFSTDHLVAPAGKPFDLAFDNEDTVQHNVAIYAGADASAPNKFRGDIFAGPKTTTYHVPALDAGSYSFQCDVHPNMKGTLDAH